jgi:hypothetical protein
MNVQTERIKAQCHRHGNSADSDRARPEVHGEVHLLGERVDAYRERRGIVENTASADLEPNHVSANDVDAQSLAVQFREHSSLGAAHGIDPLETHIAIGVDHRPTLPHRQASTGCSLSRAAPQGRRTAPDHQRE